MPERTGPVVAITGASGGVGRATALAFARRGARIGLIARGKRGLEGARADVERRGADSLVLRADVADARAVEEAADRLVERFGTIDVWINGAMTTVFAPVAETTPDEIRRVTEVTYLGQVHGAMAALKHMRKADRGTIVMVGSALAYRGLPLQAAYCASKFAVRGFTDSLRCELLRDGSRVRLTMVQLPGLNTPQFSWCRSKMPRKPQPVPPFHQPEVAADAIVYAAEKAPRELWVGKSTLQVVGGELAAPEVMDRIMAQRGYDGQMVDGPPEPDRPDNLFAPADDDVDFGARGPFGDRARSSGFFLEEGFARKAALAGGLGLAAAAVGLGMLGARSLPRLTGGD